MLKGGYQIVDFKDIELTEGVATTIAGVYAAIEGTRKAILLSGLNIAGTEYHDVFIEVTLSDSDYTFTAYAYTFTVMADDTVTATAGA